MEESEGEVRDRVVELLNQAAFLTSEKERINTLGRVQELVVHREPELLDTFYEEIVAFQHDKNADVRKWVVSFMEEACKKDSRMLPILLPNVQLLLEDSAVSVVKRCLQAMVPVHRCILQWMAQAHAVTPDMELSWIILSGIKAKILAMIDHDNDGVRTQVIKCLESIILVQSYSEPSSVRRDKEPLFCLDDVPLTLKLARPRKLEEEAKQLLQKLVSFQGSIHISAVNLMTCMSTLVILARARPVFMGTVVQALQLLHANLPPTLTKSQVNSVRKHLKLQLVNMLKHTAAGEFHDSIVAVLSDLGMSTNELNKAVPNREEMRRAARKRERAKAAGKRREGHDHSNEGGTRKRARLHASTTATASDSSTTTTATSTTSTSASSSLFSSTSSKLNKEAAKDAKSGGISSKDAKTFLSHHIKSEMEDPVIRNDDADLVMRRLLTGEQDRERLDLPGEDGGGTTLLETTAKWLVERLTIESVTELVMTSMLSLPPTMPGVFSAGYTPVSGAGTLQQKQQLARLLAAQLVAASVSPVAPLASAVPPEDQEDGDLQRLAGDSDDEGPLVAFLGSRPSQYTVPPPALPAPVLAPIRHKIKAVKLSEVTPVLTLPQQRSLQLVLAKRLLSTYQLTTLRSVERRARERLIATVLALATDDELKEMEAVILSDIAKYSSLIEAWLFSLHSNTNDFTQLGRLTAAGTKGGLLGVLGGRRGSGTYRGYDAVLVRVVRAALPQCHEEEVKDALSQVLLCCPSVPLEVVSVLVECASPTVACPVSVVALSTVTPLLRDLALWRSSVATHTATMMCSLATHHQLEVRDAVLSEIEAILLSGGTLAETVVCAGKTQLLYLVEPTPPLHLYAEYLGRSRSGVEGDEEQWDEATVRACLHLPLAILPLHQSLVHDLAHVYVKTVNEAKRGILRLLDAPVGLMGMDSPQLLALVHNTPKGSETLITRIIHILTEKAPPSEALVCQVRELYNRRVSDVRFLIPVLTGLSKKEVIAVLHKLIKLNPHVVKEVFNRLWGVTLDTGSSPLSPVELLVALHLIEADKCDVKTVIKATGLCFQERSIYTPEVLGATLQQLLEEPVIPTLLMRTVIMALTHHPCLQAFVITVLARLIDKNVWEFPKVWEGFIKCCERATPQSVTVLLQLPHQHLSTALDTSEALKTMLKTHLAGLTTQQREHLSPSLLSLVGVAAAEEPPKDTTADTPPVRELTSPIQHTA